MFFQGDKSPILQCQIDSAARGYFQLEDNFSLD